MKVYLELEVVIEDRVGGALDNFSLVWLVGAWQQVDLHHSVRGSGQQVSLLQVLTNINVLPAPSLSMTISYLPCTPGW